MFNKSIPVFVLALFMPSPCGHATSVEEPPRKPGWNDTFSWNQQFSAEISAFHEEVIVYSRKLEQREKIWSRTLTRTKEETAWQDQSGAQYELAVADDGKAVAMHPVDQGERMPGLR